MKNRLGLSMLAVLAVAVAAGCGEPPTDSSVGTVALQSILASVPPQSDYVFTPGGWYHRSCVHEIPNGAVTDTGGLVRRVDGTTYKIPPCRYPSYPNFRHSSQAGRQQPAPVSSGWTLFAYDTLPKLQNWYQLIHAVWTVPAAPVGTYTYPTVYFAFTGLQSDRYIIQPVIQYGYSAYGGGNYWTMAAWECGHTAESCSHSTPITIAAGDSIEGWVESSFCTNGVCTWTVDMKDWTTGQSTWRIWNNDPYVYWYAAGGVVETNGQTYCAQYPATGVFFYSMNVWDRYGNVYPAWRDTVQFGANPNCAFSVTSTPSTVNLYHNQVPLADYITNDGNSWYTAHPSGGRPPYSNYWEWCAIDCSGGGGGNGPAARGGVGPNQVVHGWQFISTAWSIYWPYLTQVTLRSTVTDALSNQAVATYWVP